MDELNPNHPVTTELREQYHKLLAIVMWRFGMDALTVTSEEIERFVADHPGGINVAFEPKGHTLRIRIVDDREGARLARKEGGLPT